MIERGKNGYPLTCKYMAAHFPGLVQVLQSKISTMIVIVNHKSSLT